MNATPAKPATAAPAKRGRKPGSTVAPLVADYSKLELSEVASLPTQTRDSRVDQTPFPAALATRTAKALTVPAAAADQTEALIRTAARRLNIGVAIRRENVNGGNSVKITFQAKDKRVNKTAK